MSGLIKEMNGEEFYPVFTTELFDSLNKMIDEKKLLMKNAILLLKRLGYWKIMKDARISTFERSSLCKMLEKMIIKEDQKKDKKNEKLLVDLCECYIMLSNVTSSKLLSICVHCLLKAGLKKEEDKETQKEVEMAMLALNHLNKFKKLDKELYLNEIKEIIEYHQEHRNLTQLAYQSAWQFLTGRLYFDPSLDHVIVNELHFEREAARELEELTRNVNWKKRKEEEKRDKESRETKNLKQWLQTIAFFLEYCQLWNDEIVDLVCSIVKIFRAAKDNHKELCDQCISLFEEVAGSKNGSADGLLNSGAVELILEEIQQSTLDFKMTINFFLFLIDPSSELKEKKRDEMEEAKRKNLKRKVFEKMEEEGYEDTVTSFLGIFYFLREKYCDHTLSLDISDYLVNV
ncbi:uncharacterized protein MONOS_4668 [Monocercomonoides exilis]|uniref:uncharacterized protein n=1 Tax=Monocercomonoides exilis TaxID=2049356 RepID=UPI003559E31D|nr:hypothetical protein MONOS_4668 [Monocercomonoides exilis]|eukprot:MONOS_4668.1-p1 / transcript=MONOS_4668.1 / gene=MONOS_4668 / organism=Monocercomonoides_exilis_PA203 / gene_product=unspecified product / transcript_product=unspecified product / location=Mono_scaffold00126:83041-84307(+) / protein_length=402 / sequence_SO=supercontig / SO=protein_coding / is_pseudo=false